MPAHASSRARALVLASLAEGRTPPEAAAAAGVHERTVYRWMAEATFKAELNTLRASMLDRVAGKLSSLGASAVETLTELLGDDSPSIRLGAVRTTLDFGLRVQEQVVLTERVAALEERLAGRGVIEGTATVVPLSHRRTNFGGVQ